MKLFTRGKAVSLAGGGLVMLSLAACTPTEAPVIPYVAPEIKPVDFKKVDIDQAEVKTRIDDALKGADDNRTNKIIPDVDGDVLLLVNGSPDCTNIPKEVGITDSGTLFIKVEEPAATRACMNEKTYTAWLIDIPAGDKVLAGNANFENGVSAGLIVYTAESGEVAAPAVQESGPPPAVPQYTAPATSAP